MKSDYWNVSDEQVREKTGKSLADWTIILEKFGARSRKSNEIVAFLRTQHGMPRYWARTLTTRFLNASE